MVFKNDQAKLDAWHKKLEDKVKARGHILISGKMTSNQRESCYLIYCPKHDCENETSYFNYIRSRNGCLFCGRDSVSDQLQGREFSEETLEKMKTAAQGRPNRGGKPRRWRETHAYRTWKDTVQNEWNNECAITGIKQTEGLLVVHHLYGVSLREDLALVVKNGVLIHEALHVLFHKTYGYRNNTIAQFMDFIQRILKNEINASISSQGELESSQGSETRVYDPARIMQLHERLSEIQAILEII